jgi:hypothetical protein
MKRLNKFLDKSSEFLAHRKGLLPLVGVLFVLMNGILQFLPVEGWVVATNLLLHLGIILAIIGILLAWAL